MNASECLYAEALANAVAAAAGTNLPKSRVARPDWTFDPSTALAALKSHFAVNTLSGFGFADDQPCLVAAGAAIIYLQETLKASLQHIRRLRPHRADALLTLDEVTRRSLELTRTLRDNQRDGSLLSVLDRSVTPMGSRLLHDSLLAPLTNLDSINSRLDAVEELLKDHALRQSVREHLESCADIQRLTTRVSTAKAGPRDLSAIARTLRKLPAVKAKLAGRRSALLQDLEKRLELCPDIRELLDKAIEEDPAALAKEGGVIRAGFSPELDELRALATDGKNWIARYQAAEITRNRHREPEGRLQRDRRLLPGNHQRERDEDPRGIQAPEDAQEREAVLHAGPPRVRGKVVTSQDKSKALELQLFVTIRDQVAAQTPRLLNTAEVLAVLDLLAALAELAAARNYVRPVLVDEPILDIRDGRHPVLDQILPPGTFVPNDAAFGPDDGTFWLVTGPNMAGKSTVMRQVALIALMGARRARSCRRSRARRWGCNGPDLHARGGVRRT